MLKLWLCLGCLALTSALVIVDSALASSCIYYMKGFDWGCGGTGQGHAMYMCRCQNVDWLGSVSNCMDSQGSNRQEIVHAWKHLATRCLQKAHLDFSVAEIEAWSDNATHYLQSPPVDRSIPIHSTLSVNTSDFAIYRSSFDQINHHVFKTQWLGWGLVLFWGAYIAALTVLNVLWSCYRVPLFGKRAKQAYQKYLLQPAGIFGLDRIDLLLMALFTIQTVLSTCFSYTVALPNVYIDNLYLLTLDLIGYRSAIIAFSLMPVVYCFGLRNNPFCFLTGLPQAAFIKYHKFVAIIMSVEALVHSAVWTAYAMRSGGYKMWAMDDYWRWGITGTVLLFVLLGQSISIIRTAMYELFVWLHKILGWLFIVAMWYHCKLLGWMGWVYSIIALTVYDRSVRLFKTYFINRGYSRVKVQVVDDKVVKLRVEKSILFDTFYKPGSHIYISFYHWPIWYQCFQSHPYTIVTSPLESSDAFSIYLRIKKGSTKTLARIASNEKGYLEMWALIEGPYGNGIVVHDKDDDVVAIAGGVGLSALLPSLFLKPLGSTLFWAVNNLEDVEYFDKDLTLLMEMGADVRVFLTREFSEDCTSLEKSYKYLSVLEERPDVCQWIKEAKVTALDQGKSHLKFMSCGPTSMDSAVQVAACHAMDIGLNLLITYEKENYTW